MPLARAGRTVRFFSTWGVGVGRAIVDKQVLDQLIRAKLGDHPDCGGVKPLPVTWRRPSADGCNWVVPGWTGDSDAVKACLERMRTFLQVLRAEFDIPE